jgi:hypothetical protein
VDTLGIYLIRDADTPEAGFIIDELTLGEYANDSVLIRVYKTSSAFGSGIDSLVNTHRALKPLLAHSTRDGGGQQLKFTTDRVTGSIWLPNGQEVQIDTHLPPNIIDSGSFDLALRASELAIGQTMAMQAFVANARAVLSLDADVARIEEVSGVDCWRVDANFVGVPVTFWISRADRSLVRQVMVLQPDLSMLIDSKPLPALSFHAAVLEALDRHGALQVFEARLAQEEGNDFFALGAELAQRGLTRLNDDYLLRHTRLEHSALSRIEDVLCADWFLGRAAQETLFGFLSELDEDEMRDWADVTAAAVTAELNSDPDRDITTDEEYAQALETILFSLEEEAADRLADVLWTIDLASDSDVCWSGRVIYGTALQLDPVARADVIRALVTYDVQ